MRRTLEEGGSVRRRIPRTAAAGSARLRSASDSLTSVDTLSMSEKRSIRDRSSGLPLRDSALAPARMRFWFRSTSSRTDSFTLSLDRLVAREGKLPARSDKWRSGSACAGCGQVSGGAREGGRGRH